MTVMLKKIEKSGVIGFLIGGMVGYICLRNDCTGSKRRREKHLQ